MRDLSIEKIVDYSLIKIRQFINEKEYPQRGGGKCNSIKYMFYRNRKSSDLIIVFSSMTRKGIPARYNYVRTLENIKANKLFILDDNGPEKRGCYCLGKNRDFTVENNVLALIKSIKAENNIERTVYCGSSKGGWCALNFGLEDTNADIVVGANQYLLGNYFLALPDIRLEKWVFGDNWNEKDIEWLNNKIRAKLVDNKMKNNNIHVHISNKEHTYDEHVKFMLDDLELLQYKYDIEILGYENHGDIVKYFPEYLKKEIIKWQNKSQI